MADTHPAHRRAGAPPAAASDAIYRQRAAHYDLELAVFEPLRERAIAHLALAPGQTVLDLGCGTGLSLAGLSRRVRPGGQVWGVEPCPAMLRLARRRVAQLAGARIHLQQATADRARLPAAADGALFHFTHDILQQPAALDHVLAHLRPGARVVACGLCWAAPWNGFGNLFVAGAAWYSITSPDGLDAPWRSLAARLPDLVVERLWMGTIYLARGTVPPPSPAPFAGTAHDA